MKPPGAFLALQSSESTVHERSGHRKGQATGKVRPQEMSVDNRAITPLWGHSLLLPILLCRWVSGGAVVARSRVAETSIEEHP